MVFSAVFKKTHILFSSANAGTAPNINIIDISTQILASQSILRRVNFDILKGHFEHCIRESLAQDSETDKDKKIGELVAVLDKILRQ